MVNEKRYQVPFAFLDTFDCRGVKSFGSAALELGEIARGTVDVFLLNGLLVGILLLVY